MSMSHNGLDPHDGPVDWGVSRTKQSQEPATNINNIVAKYMKTGQLTHISETLGQYRDVSGLPDLHEAMNLVAAAQSSFNELPAAIRKRVGHDVANFLPFIDDPANLEECVELGLLPESALPKTKTVPTPPEPAEPPAQGGE